MKYLLDTNICIYFLNNNPIIVDKLRQAEPEDIAISLVTLAELQFGAHNSSQVQNNLRRVEFLEKTVRVIPLTSEITGEYAKIKARLRKSGNF